MLIFNDKGYLLCLHAKSLPKLIYVFVVENKRLLRFRVVIWDLNSIIGLDPLF